MNPALLSLQEVANLLHVSYGTARNLYWDGILTGFKVRKTIRIHRASVDRLLNEQPPDEAPRVVESEEQQSEPSLPPVVQPGQKKKRGRPKKRRREWFP